MTIYLFISGRWCSPSVQCHAIRRRLRSDLAVLGYLDPRDHYVLVLAIILTPVLFRAVVQHRQLIKMEPPRSLPPRRSPSSWTRPRPSTGSWRPSLPGSTWPNGSQTMAIPYRTQSDQLRKNAHVFSTWFARTIPSHTTKVNVCLSTRVIKYLHNISPFRYIMFIYISSIGARNSPISAWISPWSPSRQAGRDLDPQPPVGLHLRSGSRGRPLEQPQPDQLLISAVIYST